MKYYDNDNGNLKELKRTTRRLVNAAFYEYKNKNYKATIKLLEDVPNNFKSPTTYHILAQSYMELKKYDKVKKNLLKLVEIKPDHVQALFSLGKFALKDNNKEEAETYFKKVLEANAKSGNLARLELGKIYLSQGRIDEAEEQFREALKRNKEEIYAGFQLARIYIEKNQDKEYKEIYEYLCENFDIEDYDEERVHKHIQRHWEDDLTKNKHGVFIKSYEEIKEAMATATIKRQRVYMSDLYSFKLENCGYEGGKNGDQHQLDYVTIVTVPFKTDILTMFPSDEVIIKKEINLEKDHYEEER